jgi:hypothetical protein
MTPATSSGSGDIRLIFDAIVAVVAVLGFVLGIVNLVYTWWTSRPHVRVTLTVGVAQYPTGLGPALFILTAINTGRQPVTISSVGVDLGAEGDTGVFIEPPPWSPPLPFTLEPGRVWAYHVDPAEVIAMHVGTMGPVRGPFANDEAGHHWSGRSKRAWLDGWAGKKH